MPLWPIIITIIRIASVLIAPFLLLHSIGAPTVKGSDTSKKKWLHKKDNE